MLFYTGAAMGVSVIPMVEAYCMKCKGKTEMKDPKPTKMANGRDAIKGVCPKCGTGMFKIGTK